MSRANILPVRSPDVEALLRLLSACDVEYVLAGSVAVASYGVDLTPGDLDIVPDLAEENLARIAVLLQDLNAHPDALGHWEKVRTGRRRWIDHGATDEELLAWRPDPGRIETLDHLFRTTLGNLDIVPSLAGTYEELLAASSWREIDGVTIRIVRASRLLETMQHSAREKDQPRIAKLREVVTGKRADAG